MDPLDLNVLNETLLDELKPRERELMKRLLDQVRAIWEALPGPQTEAKNNQADILGYGGAAGGGKSDLIIGVGLTDHERVLIARREKAQTEGIVQRMREILPEDKGYSSQHSRWRVSAGSSPLIEFAGLDNPGDEGRWQGRPHDLIALDEATEMREAQARFLLGWNRTKSPDQRCRAIMTFNPPMNPEGRWVIKFFGPWLDRKHPNPAEPGELRWFTTIGDNEDHEVPDDRRFVLVDGEITYDFDELSYQPEDIITPKSRTFIPARVTDNPYYMESGYIATLQAMPAEARARMLYGDFDAGIEDDEFQVIKTAWVEAAQKRWVKPDILPEMDSMGVDVAMGGKDKTEIARRHGMWFDEAVSYTGKECVDSPTVAGFVVARVRDRSPIHVDTFGVGGPVQAALCAVDQQAMAVNMGDPAGGTAQEGNMPFFNLRTQLWWRMREALDPANNTGIALPPDQELLADLCTPKWRMQGRAVRVQSREEIVKELGRSPDRGTAYVLALMQTMKYQAAQHLLGGQRADSLMMGHDPFRDI